jgi:hypothetical protein
MRRTESQFAPIVITKMQMKRRFFAQPALCGRHVSWGLRQSMPSSMYAIYAAEIDTTPPAAEGQMNLPRSRRLA